MQTLDTFLLEVTHVEVSEFFELVCSLHVLMRPEHHPFRLTWAQKVSRQLPADLLDEAMALGDLTHEWLALLDLPANAGGSGDFGSLGAHLESLPDAEFLVLLFNQRYSLGQILIWLNGNSGTDTSERLTEAQRWALTNPTAARLRVTRFVRAYYESCFQEEWARIEPWLVQAQREYRHRFNDNPIHALSQLHPRLYIRPDAIYAQKAELYRWPYDQVKRIRIDASTFIHPHLLVRVSANELSFALPVPVPDVSKSAEAPSDLVKMFKALADPTRLSILHSLVEKPHCTQQLARIHGISEAAVSKHLKALLEARFVSTERRGNYVFYGPEVPNVESIIVYLRNFLEQ